MADKSVKNSATGTMGTDAAKRTRYEKMETAYGKIPLASYVTGDVLVFDQIPAKEIVYGRFVTSEGGSLEVFNKTDFSSTVAWSFASATGTNPLDIHYVIHYKKGTGKRVGATTVQDGELLKIAVTIT